MIPYPMKKKAVILGLFVILIVLLTDVQDYQFISTASLTLLGIFGGIAVAAALVFLANADESCNRAVERYKQVRDLSQRAEHDMRMHFENAKTHIYENIQLIIGCSVFNFVLILLSNISFIQIVKDEQGEAMWPFVHKPIYALCSLSVISALFAVLDTVRSLQVLSRIDSQSNDEKMPVE